MATFLTLVSLAVAAGGFIALRRAGARSASSALADALDAQLAAENVQKFNSRVGFGSPFFVPRTNDVVPSATVSGPLGLNLPIPVIATDEHSDFGARWQLCVPQWGVAGNYRINVSSGEVYDVAVKEN